MMPAAASSRYLKVDVPLTPGCLHKSLKNVCATALQAEGEKLSRRNGELEATARRLRGSLRETETERDRLLGRSQGLEEQLLREQDRYAAATQAAAAQVCQRAHQEVMCASPVHIVGPRASRCHHACSKCRGGRPAAPRGAVNMAQGLLCLNWRKAWHAGRLLPRVPIPNFCTTQLSLCLALVTLFRPMSPCRLAVGEPRRRAELHPQLRPAADRPGTQGCCVSCLCSPPGSG